jgi:hypothetical protein
MWGMGKGLINREECNTSQELSVQAEAALIAITIEASIVCFEKNDAHRG